MPLKVVQVDLARGVEPVWTGGRYQGVRALVRYRGVPVGWVRVRSKGSMEVGADTMREAIVRQLGPRLPALVYGPATPPAPPSEALPPITVVVCTRDRAELLEGCLAALAALDYPEYEVLVVDNAGRTADTALLAERRGARCVREDRPGLDWARNRGIAAARHDVVAFTDDDARPDPGWLRAIGAAFVDPTVMAVTGPVAPVELETRAQQHFELVGGGMAHGFARRRLRRAELTDKQLLWASSFGVGANMAFRRAVFADVRPFDPALDVGTASGGGGDVELLHRLVARGHTLAYEPSALVWHLHRRDFESLRRLMFDNGRSFACYLYTCWRNRTVSRAAIARFFLLTWVGGWIVRRVVRPKRDRRHLALLELLGVALSPYYYRAARAQARRAAGLVRGARETPPRVFLVDGDAPPGATAGGTAPDDGRPAEAPASASTPS